MTARLQKYYVLARSESADYRTLIMWISLEDPVPIIEDPDGKFVESQGEMGPYLIDGVPYFEVGRKLDESP